MDDALDDLIQKMHREGIHVFDIYTPPLMVRSEVWAHPAHLGNLLHPLTGRESASAVIWQLRNEHRERDWLRAAGAEVEP